MSQKKNQIQEEIVTTFINSSDSPVPPEEIARNHSEIASRVEEFKRSSANPIFRKNNDQKEQKKPQ